MVALLVSFTASSRCNVNEGKTVEVRSCSFCSLCLVLNYGQSEQVSVSSDSAEGGSSASLLQGKSSSTNKLTNCAVQSSP